MVLKCCAPLSEFSDPLRTSFRCGCRLRLRVNRNAGGWGTIKDGHVIKHDVQRARRPVPFPESSDRRRVCLARRSPRVCRRVQRPLVNDTCSHDPHVVQRKPHSWKPSQLLPLFHHVYEGGDLLSGHELVLIGVHGSKAGVQVTVSNA